MIYNDIALFTAVARHLNYSQAAQELNVTPSLVSRRLAVLEERIGYKLFERTTRQVRLTSEGKKLLDLCEAPIESLTSALSSSQEGAEGTKGRISITAPVVAAKRDIWPCLLPFLQEYPDISIDLVPANDYLDFLKDGIDLAFRLGPLPPSDLVARPLWQISYAVCASQAFLDKHRISDKVDAAQASSLPAIAPLLPWRFEEDKSYRPANISHQMGDLELAGQAITAGLGIGFLPTNMIKGDLRPIHIEGLTPQERTMYLVYPSRRLLPRRVRLLVDWLTAPTR